MTLNTSGVNYVTYDVQGAMATGTYTGDGSGAIVVNCGFTPKYVYVADVTDVTTFEWIQGMGANTFKAVSGAVTVDATGLIQTNGKLFNQSSVGNYQPPGGAGSGTIINSGTIQVFGTDPTVKFELLLAAALNLSGKAYTWMALGG